MTNYRIDTWGLYHDGHKQWFLVDRTNDLAYAATLRPSGVCLSSATDVFQLSDTS